MAERAEVSPGARKLSIHLTLPDFQDASTGLLSFFNEGLPLYIFGL